MVMKVMMVVMILMLMMIAMMMMMINKPTQFALSCAGGHIRWQNNNRFPKVTPGNSILSHVK